MNDVTSEQAELDANCDANREKTLYVGDSSIQKFSFLRLISSNLRYDRHLCLGKIPKQTDSLRSRDSWQRLWKESGLRQIQRREVSKMREMQEEEGSQPKERRREMEILKEHSHSLTNSPLTDFEKESVMMRHYLRRQQALHLQTSPDSSRDWRMAS